MKDNCYANKLIILRQKNHNLYHEVHFLNFYKYCYTKL